MNQRWTPEADAQLAALYPTLRAGEIARRMGRARCSIKNRVYVLGLKKPEGATNSGRFMPGQKSWNKGMKGVNCGGKATQFKPGHLGGRGAQLRQPIGTERLSKEGYLQRKVNDDRVFCKRWRFVHVMVWEEANGPVPQSHVIGFKNGDKTDIRPDNLECIHRRVLMQRNTVHNYPEELRQVIRLKGAITKRITTRIKKEQHP
jgi:hypothetical protein